MRDTIQPSTYGGVISESTDRDTLSNILRQARNDRTIVSETSSELGDILNTALRIRGRSNIPNLKIKRNDLEKFANKNKLFIILQNPDDTFEEYGNNTDESIIINKSSDGTYSLGYDGIKETSAMPRQIMPSNDPLQITVQSSVAPRRPRPSYSPFLPAVAPSSPPPPPPPPVAPVTPALLAPVAPPAIVVAVTPPAGAPVTPPAGAPVTTPALLASAAAAGGGGAAAAAGGGGAAAAAGRGGAAAAIAAAEAVAARRAATAASAWGRSRSSSSRGRRRSSSSRGKEEEQKQERITRHPG